MLIKGVLQVNRALWLVDHPGEFRPLRSIFTFYLWSLKWFHTNSCVCLFVAPQQLRPTLTFDLLFNWDVSERAATKQTRDLRNFKTRRAGSGFRNEEIPTGIFCCRSAPTRNSSSPEEEEEDTQVQRRFQPVRSLLVARLMRNGTTANSRRNAESL